MKLQDLMPNVGAKKERKRVGRGHGAGQGKTSGRGTKGQGSRSGEKGNLYRQGGNLPFFRRLPFIRGEGFTPPNRVNYTEINLDQLDRIPAGTEINPQSLLDANLIKNLKNKVVLLGRGEITTALTVKTHRISQSARAKIEKAGGSVELIA